MNAAIEKQFPGLEEGVILVANVRNVPLPHPQTAESPAQVRQTARRAGSLGGLAA
jgi:hypothetical protein